MTDDEYFKAECRHLKATIRFFESKNKHRREKHVVREFLTNLGQQFLMRELKPTPDDPPDVEYLDCKFEIKEHMDPRERHREYKEALKKLCEAKDPSVLMELYTPRDIALSKVYELVFADAQALVKKKYPLAVVRGLDLLVYVNLEDVLDMRVTPLPDVIPLASLGWRSVSFVMGHWSCVLAVSEDAPAFLQESVGTAIHRKPPRHRSHLTLGAADAYRRR